MKYLLIISAVLIGVILFAYFKIYSVTSPEKEPLNLINPEATISINNVQIEVEIVDTFQERRLGLSFKDRLDEGQGMLFLFDSSQVQTFWMKDMKFSLDIIWINDLKIVKIDKNVPPPAPGTADSDLARYTSENPVNYVLEVPAGFSDKNSFKVGDSVELPGS